MMTVEVELNAGGIGVGAVVTAILHECGHNVFDGLDAEAARLARRRHV
jgi:hypothetical protein